VRGIRRPPDLRHLDAAFQAVGSAPLGTSSLRAWITERFATRCPTCGRTLAAEELIWERPPAGGDVVPTRRAFRCAACLDRRGRGNELHQAPPEAADLDLCGHDAAECLCGGWDAERVEFGALEVPCQAAVDAEVVMMLLEVGVEAHALAALAERGDEPQVVEHPERPVHGVERHRRHSLLDRPKDDLTHIGTAPGSKLPRRCGIRGPAGLHSHPFLHRSSHHQVFCFFTFINTSMDF